MFYLTELDQDESEILSNQEVYHGDHSFNLFNKKTNIETFVGRLNE